MKQFLFNMMMSALLVTGLTHSSAVFADADSASSDVKVLRDQRPSPSDLKPEADNSKAIVQAQASTSRRESPAEFEKK